jgi:protein-arginine kinase activator protein McsA
MVTPKLKTVKELRQELSRLVAEENYEQAAIVRDKIKEMEAKGDE